MTCSISRLIKCNGAAGSVAGTCFVNEVPVEGESFPTIFVYYHAADFSFLFFLRVALMPPNYNSRVATEVAVATSQMAEFWGCWACFRRKEKAKRLRMAAAKHTTEPGRWARS
ncbi:MAG TPA: hypothetical protein VG754_12290, partial [Verrucomicrobiae bacterium]|nr:hypothetical protein [Verrucomicrobiae bacterium]